MKAWSKKFLLSIIGLLLGALALTGCGHDNSKDLKNVPNSHPDYVVNYENMDKQPNVAMLCIHGVGFATTTRDYNALTKVPEWNDFCKTKMKK